MIREFEWGDYPAVRTLWETAGNAIVPEPELRATLAANPGLLLVAEESGIAGVVLMVLPENTAGLAFWQRLGYLPRPDVLCTEPV